MLDCFRRENSAREPAPPRQLDVSHSKISAPGSPGRASYSLAILSSEQSVLTTGICRWSLEIQKENIAARTAIASAYEVPVVLDDVFREPKAQSGSERGPRLIPS
jgi:hypothetical protein